MHCRSLFGLAFCPATSGMKMWLVASPSKSLSWMTCTTSTLRATTMLVGALAIIRFLKRTFQRSGLHWQQIEVLFLMESSIQKSVWSASCGSHWGFHFRYRSIIRRMNTPQTQTGLVPYTIQMKKAQMKRMFMMMLPRMPETMPGCCPGCPVLSSLRSLQRFQGTVKVWTRSNTDGRSKAGRTLVKSSFPLSSMQSEKLSDMRLILTIGLRSRRVTWNSFEETTVVSNTSSHWCPWSNASMVRTMCRVDDGHHSSLTPIRTASGFKCGSARPWQAIDVSYLNLTHVGIEWREKWMKWRMTCSGRKMEITGQVGSGKAGQTGVAIQLGPIAMTGKTAQVQDSGQVAPGEGNSDNWSNKVGIFDRSVGKKRLFFAIVLPLFCHHLSVCMADTNIFSAANDHRKALRFLDMELQLRALSARRMPQHIDESQRRVIYIGPWDRTVDCEKCSKVQTVFSFCQRTPRVVTAASNHPCSSTEEIKVWRGIAFNLWKWNKFALPKATACKSQSCFTMEENCVLSPQEVARSKKPKQRNSQVRRCRRVLFHSECPRNVSEIVQFETDSFGRQFKHGSCHFARYLQQFNACLLTIPSHFFSCDACFVEIYCMILYVYICLNNICFLCCCCCCCRRRHNCCCTCCFWLGSWFTCSLFTLVFRLQSCCSRFRVADLVRFNSWTTCQSLCCCSCYPAVWHRCCLLLSFLRFVLHYVSLFFRVSAVSIFRFRTLAGPLGFAIGPDGLDMLGFWSGP